MKTLQAKEGYIFVAKDKSQVYGNLIYTPDNFDETLIMQVTEAKGEEIRKSIEEEMMKKYQEEVNK